MDEDQQPKPLDSLGDVGPLKPSPTQKGADEPLTQGGSPLAGAVELSTPPTVSPAPIKPAENFPSPPPLARPNPPPQPPPPFPQRPIPPSSANTANPSARQTLAPPVVPTKKVSPPPPGPEVEVRTMKSDLASLQQSGGGSATPEVITLNIKEKEARAQTPPPSPQAKKISEEELRIPGYTGPEEPVFQPHQSTPPPTEKIEKQAVSKKSGKKLLAALVVVIALGGLFALGYFVVFPLLFPAQETIPPAPPPPQPPPPPPEPPPPPAQIHQSLFVVVPPLSSITRLTLLLSAVNHETIFAATQEVDTALAENNLAEVIFRDGAKEASQDTEEVFVKTRDLLAALFPSYASENLSETLDILSDDATVFVYKKDGLWPGIIVALKDPSQVASARALLALVESPSFVSIKNIFVQDPGNPDVAGFKDGKIGDLTTRYITFQTPGAAFNYAVSDDGKVFISASYFGLVEAINFLAPPTPPALQQ